MKPKWAVLWLPAVALLWTGCTTAQVQAVRHAATRIEPQEVVAIVFSRHFSLDAQPVEEKEIATCISDEARKAHPNLRILPPDEFRRAAFPDLAPEAAPNSPEYFALLLDNAVFRERVASLGIRYLISLRSETESTRGKGLGPGFFCGAAPGAAGCIGMLGSKWHRKTHMIASVFDLKESRGAGKVEASASGEPWFALVGMFPFPFIPLGAPAFTESKACGELGQALAKFLAGERPSEPEEDQK